MNLSESATIVKKVMFSYGGFFKDMPIDGMVSVWHDELKEYDYENTMKALSDYIKGNKYPPAICDIIRKQEPEYTPEEMALRTELMK